MSLPKQYALLYTYDGKDPHIYLCSSKLNAQKEMLSSIAETYEEATSGGCSASFKIAEDILSAKLVMKRNKKSETMFVCVVPVYE